VILACTSQTPLLVPLGETVWGVVCWFAGVRQWLRQPDVFFRTIAEQRARSRLLHPLGGGDPEKEFRQQRRLRWIVPVTVLGYVACVIGAWVHVLICGTTFP
jgi:hypothetical protein